jgi:hypothetical protein
VWVRKSDGSLQEFDKSKIVRTCVRIGASPQEAQSIANRIEKKVYDGITTKQILAMVFDELKKLRPEMAYRIDLRKAISLLRPKPDFENFIGLVFKAYGYKVSPPQQIRGKYVEYEIDGILKKGARIICLEIKHHFPPHVKVELDEVLALNSAFQDLTEGYETGITPVRFTQAMIVTNTSLTPHALRYARGRGIRYMSWNQPQRRNLERLVEKKKLYPITLIKGVSQEVAEKLYSANVILLKHLVEKDISELAKVGILKRKLLILRRKAKGLLK